MSVLSIKVPIRKKSGNLFNDPRIYIYGKYDIVNIFPELSALTRKEIMFKKKYLWCKIYPPSLGNGLTDTSMHLSLNILNRNDQSVMPDNHFIPPFQHNWSQQSQSESKPINNIPFMKYLTLSLTQGHMFGALRNDLERLVIERSTG